MDERRSLLLILTLLGVLRIGSCLECYVCSNQDANDGKCLKTIATCEQGDDMCMTEIKWGTMPYWQAGAEKQFYISKRCAKERECDRVIRKYMPYCTHIWYEDWKCAECCAGDRCNYYIISGGNVAASKWPWLGLALSLKILLSQVF